MLSLATATKCRQVTALVREGRSGIKILSSLKSEFRGRPTNYSLITSRVSYHTSTTKSHRDCRGPDSTAHDPTLHFRKQWRSSSTLSQDLASSYSKKPYEPPTTGLLGILPKSVVPYAELVRLDKPVGTYYLFFPCLFSTFVAASMASPITPPMTVLGTAGLFLTGALVMRGAGCVINDLWDRNLDPHVERTRLRPIARGAISTKAGVIFFGTQMFTGLAVLLQFPSQCLWYGIPSVPLVIAYPLAKRVTHYPQAVLGLAFSWGSIMGFPALGIDLLSNHAALCAAACLYTSNVSWTILYDMIYAHQDIKDDAKAGIKSIALRYEKETKWILSGLAVLQIGLLGAAGVAADLGPLFFVGSCGGATVTLGTMIWKVNLKDTKSCWWWFKNGCLLTGGTISLGLLANYLMTVKEANKDVREVL